jgi:hypothetical protein
LDNEILYIRNGGIGIMAKLANVLVAADLTSIMHGGETYYRLAEGEKAQEGDLFYVTKHRLARYVEVNRVYRVCEYERFVDEDGDTLECVISGVRDGLFYRKAPAKPASTTELLAVKRAEVAELEARLRAEITAGAVAVVVGPDGDDETGSIGKLVRIEHVDESDYEGLPYRCGEIVGGDSNWYPFASIEPVTYESARARLIADVDRQLAAAFPDAKVAA